MIRDQPHRPTLTQINPNSNLNPNPNPNPNPHWHTHFVLLQVCDFGLSKAEENDRDMTAGVGTVAYMAPEMMDPDADAATKVCLPTLNH